MRQQLPSLDYAGPRIDSPLKRRVGMSAAVAFDCFRRRWRIWILRSGISFALLTTLYAWWAYESAIHTWKRSMYIVLAGQSDFSVRDGLVVMGRVVSNNDAANCESMDGTVIRAHDGDTEWYPDQVSFGGPRGVMLIDCIRLKNVSEANSPDRPHQITYTCNFEVRPDSWDSFLYGGVVRFTTDLTMNVDFPSGIVVNSTPLFHLPSHE